MIATTSGETSERLRASVETRLEQFGERSASAARDLRAEVTGGIENLHESVTLTLNERLTELAAVTTAQGQAARTDIHDGLTRVGAAVSDTLQQISVQQKEGSP